MGKRKQPAAGPKRVTPAARRRMLLAAAARLFARRGYARTTVERIAEAAGVTPAAAAKHFPTKAAVLAAAYAEFHAAAFVPPADAPDPVAHLTELADRFAAAARAHAPVVAAVLHILAGGGDRADGEAVEAGLRRSGEAVADLIRAGQAAGVVRRQLDPPAAARDWLRYLFGLALLRPADAPPGESDDSPPPAADVLVHGLLKTDV